ncbi:MAG: hypothetical protein CMJ18_04635 [Phycisphaeraceae bacterium]|nr:hypothetical protein [Phycisphaeraceae bacterium]
MISARLRLAHSIAPVRRTIALALLALPVGAAADDAARSLIAPTFVDRPPVLDGKMSEGEWDRVTRITGFRHTDLTLAARQTEVWAAFDEEHLYVCFRSENPGGVRATIKDRDAVQIFGEDAVEIFIQPGGEGTYYQFAANGLNTRFDSRDEKSNWNGQWKAASGIVKDQWFVGATWTIELAIPFQILGAAKAPPDGTVWRANFCRDWTAVDATRRATSWAQVGGAFHNPSRFGDLLFDRESPAIQVTDLGDLSRGKIALRGLVAARREQQVDLALAVSPVSDPATRTTETGMTVHAAAQPAPFALDASVAAPGATTWPARLAFTAGARSRTYYRALIPFGVEPGFAVDIRSVFTRKFLEARFDISRMTGLPPSITGRVAIANGSGRTLALTELGDLDRTMTGTARLDFRDVAPGDYTLRMTLRDNQEKVLNETTRPYRIPEPPEWLGNTIGISDEVPKPFEAVRVKGNAVSMSGRTYHFDDAIFPTRIVNQDVEQLARPAQLVLMQGGKKIAWTDVASVVRRAVDAEAEIAYTADSTAATVEGTVKVEYDGWAFFDFTVTPKGGESIDALCVELPFARDEALFMRTHGPIATWAGETMRTVLIGDVKNDADADAAEGLRSQFGDAWMPDGWKDTGEFIFQAYVGNDERGLFVVQDTEENRSLEGGNIGVRHEGDVTVLEVHLINKPTEVRKPLRYQIALVAVPFKKYRYELEYLVSMCGGHNPNFVLDNDFVGWVRGALLWHWGRIEKDMAPHPDHPDRLPRMIKNFARADMLGVVNSTCMMAPSPYEPFDTYRDEWVIDPPYALPRHQGTEVDLVMVSTNGSFADYYLWWAKRMVDEIGIGGLYFDMVSPVGSLNHLAGDGWIDEHGKRHMTSNIFSLRRLYKRLYTMLKKQGAKRGTEYYIFQHSAAGPITAFEDHLCKGEGFIREKDWRLVTPSFYRAWSLRPLGTTFTMFAGLSAPWGRESPPPHYSAQARTLIHDTLCTPMWEEQVAKDMLPIWKMRKSFNVADSTFVPWYRKDPRAKAKPSSLYVSFWHHPGKVMVAVANLTDEPVEAMLELDLQAFGIAEDVAEAAEIHGMRDEDLSTPAGARVRLDHHPGPSVLEVKRGRVALTVRAQNYSVLRVPGGGH